MNLAIEHEACFWGRLSPVFTRNNKPHGSGPCQTESQNPPRGNHARCDEDGVGGLGVSCSLERNGSTHSNTVVTMGPGFQVGVPFLPALKRGASCYKIL